MDELIHELRSYAHQRLFDGSEKYDQHLLYLADQIEEEMANYVELPEDADGKAIRVGDEVEYLDEPHVCRVVTTIDLARDGWWVYVSGTGRRPDKYLHYHRPTVEDVLRDVVTLCHNTWKEESPFHFYDVDDVMKSGNIADFAAKLRLAGDAE